MREKIQESAAEEVLKRRLRQQEIMSALAGSFISTEESDVLIKNALHMAGEFLEVTRMVIGVPDVKKGVTRAAFFWCAKDELFTTPQMGGGLDRLIRESFPKTLEQGRRPDNIYCGKVEGNPRYAVMQKMSVKSFAWIPLYVSGSLWGILSIEECLTPREWSESNIQLINLISSVITGAIERSVTEGKLKRTSAIVDKSPLFISYLDEAGEAEYVNSGAVRMSGYSAEELMEGGLKLLLSREHWERLHLGYEPLLKTGGSREFTMPICRKNGESLVINFSAFPIDEASVGIIGIDLTERARLQTELVKAKEAAENSSKAKSEFLSRMSHEMRTPMNAIIGMTSIGKSAKEVERKEYCLDKIEEASKHLLGVINDILDMSKIEAGKLEISKTEFNLEKMLQRVTNVIGFRVDEKRIDFQVNLAVDLPRVILSDEQRLAQVITNLLSNAVKFTPENGSITLGARLVEKGRGGSCVIEFRVSDTGIGISPENQKKLFHSFEQADGSISRKFGGTGLGLAISKRIVELLGGAIRVESEEGKGSSFILTVHAQRVEDGEDAAPVRFTRKNLRILAVDDSDDVREYFVSLLEKMGLACDAAADGDAACRLIEEAGARPYSMVFVDWRMPGMNGIELTREIKKRCGENMIVIMISAAEWAEIENEAKAAGVNFFLPKPLFPSMVVDCINTYLEGEKYDEFYASSPGEENSEGRFRGRTILLAEDVEINREIVITLLEETGIVIDTAENGLKAVEAFEENPGKYELIFMDIHMPEMDGYEATRTIRALGCAQAKTIPIVAMTANVFREDIEKCLASGMNDHIGKPINIEEILEKLALYLDGPKG